MLSGKDIIITQVDDELIHYSIGLESSAIGKSVVIDRLNANSSVNDSDLSYVFARRIQENFLDVNNNESLQIGLTGEYIL